MKELDNIVAAAEVARASGQSAAVATVVAVEGSAYRLPGARMLIVEGNWIAGSISGGCLEDDVVMRAREAIARNEALVTTYDTTGDDDIVFGVGLGCKGVITILIEPVRPENPAVDFLTFAKSCLRERAPGVAATVVRAHGGARAKPGARLLSRSGHSRSDITDLGLKSQIEAAIGCISEAPKLITLTLEHGSVDVFVERIQPSVPLIVFGAGHDAMPVVRLAKELGWHVTLLDKRPAYATAARFPLADRIVVGGPAETVFEDPDDGRHAGAGDDAQLPARSRVARIALALSGSIRRAAGAAQARRSVARGLAAKRRAAHEPSVEPLLCAGGAGHRCGKSLRSRTIHRVGNAGRDDEAARQSSQGTQTADT